MWWIKALFWVHATSVLVSGVIQTQADLNAFAAALKIEWKVVTNTKEAERFDVEVTLHNTDENQELGYGPWQIYFNCIFMIEPDLLGIRGNGTVEIPGQRVKVTHLQGRLFFIEPTPEFSPLPPGKMRKIKMKILYWSVARTDALHNWYMIYSDLQPVVIASTQGEELAFVAEMNSVEQWKRYDYDYYNPYTAQERYERNYIAQASYDSELRIIPSPAHFTIADASERKYVAIDSTWNIGAVGAEIRNEAVFLQQNTVIPNYFANNRPGARVVNLQIGEVDVSGLNDVIKTSDDVYSVEVNATEERITIIGRKSVGVFYGVITLLNLMDRYTGQVPECTIIDSPRFEYRGFMLDIARNFKPMKDIKDVIELMARYKMNKLHLHLSDDEGWRVEIPGLPELTELGSKHCHDPTETECLMPELGSGPDNSTEFASGFLTAAEYEELLDFAESRHVTVIPEVDMPGHARAAIKSMELRSQKLTAQGQENEGNSTLLTEPGDPSVYTSPQMFFDDAINPCIESTYKFVGIIMDTFLNYHRNQPSGIFHFGGDEVGEGAWVNSTNCQALKEAGVLPGDSPKWYFFQRVAELAEQRGLSLGAWEDGLIQGENVPFNLSSVSVNTTYAYTWDNVWEWETLPRTYGLANSGYKVVMAHGSHFYFDHPYEPDPEERGYYWATRFSDTKKTFSYNAERYYDNILTRRSGQPVTDEELCGPDNESCPVLIERDNIAGIEATLFSETTRTTEQLHGRLFPRLLAVAERAWHKAPWENLPKGAERDNLLNEDWFSFARTVGYREIPRLEMDFGVKYRIPPPGGKLSFGRLLTTPLYPGLGVQYSLDAGATWSDTSSSVDIGDYKYRIWLRTRNANSTRFSRTVVLHPGPTTMKVNQPVLDYIGQYLGVEFTVVDNYETYSDGFFQAKVKLTNKGNNTIPGGNWRVYFPSVNVVEPDYTRQGREYIDHMTKMTLAHVKGYLFSFGPSADFEGLDDGDSIEIFLKIENWSVSKYEQMPRWYVSAPGMNAKDLVSTEGEDLAFVTPFSRPQQFKRFPHDKFDPWTPATRYDRNAGLEVKPLDDIVLIPTPLMYKTEGSETLSILEGSWTVVYAAPELMGVAQYLKDKMTDFMPSIQLTLDGTAPPDSYIQFQIGEFDQSNNNSEAYHITVGPGEKTITITSLTPYGAFYAAVTLIHMAFKASPQGSLLGFSLTDLPRFPYRGMHVDTARNFVPKETIMKLLDAMALYKLNKFHFHLTDDEGWRLALPGLEEMTQIGGRRCHDLQENECIMSTLGSGAGSSDSGTGFYNVSEYKEILRYARDRFIEVIPEFDMPGHAHTSIRTMRFRKKKLEDFGNFTMSDRYLLDEANDPSHYFSVQYYQDNAINPCIESTYNFIREVYTQVKELHKDIQPLKVFHFGGDEVAKGAWVNSSACVYLLKSGVNLKEAFTHRVSEITKDVSLGAWEDGLMDHGTVPWERSSLANQDVITQAWQNVWEWGVAGRAHNLANAGYKVVFSPVTHTYFDHPQEPSPEERGFYWGTRYTDAFKTFSFMPMDFYMNADIQRSGEPVNMTEICGEDGSGCPALNKTENIIGMQGQLWSEIVRLPEQFEYMVFPRLLALAERAWHKAEWEGTSKSERDGPLRSDWARFARNLGQYDLALLDKLDIAYRVPPPGARQNGGRISTKVEYPGLKVQYKTQGSDWAELPSSRTFSAGQEVSLRTVSADGRRFSSEIKVVMNGAANKTPAPKGDGAGALRMPTLLCTIIAFLVCFI